LTGKTRLQNNVIFDGDVKPYSLTHSCHDYCQTPLSRATVKPNILTF